MTRPPAAIPAILLALAAAAASAQDDSRFREVEPGVDDIGTGAVSQLLRPVDLRAPSNFERVYEIVGTGKFARRAGAVTAVFDRSLYIGGGAAIPAGTVFYVGTLPVDLDKPGLFSTDREWVAAAPTARLNTLVTPTPAASAAPPPISATTARIAQRVDLRVGADQPTPGPPPSEANLSIWDNDPYRQRRIGEIIRTAAWRAREIEAARQAAD